MNADPTIARLARRQHALVTLGQLHVAGITRAEIRSRVGAGVLEHVHPKVLRIAGAPSTPDQEALAACLAAGPGAVASHRSAAALWDVGPKTPMVEVTVPLGRRPRPEGVIVHRSDRAWGATRRNGVPVTEPLRLALEFGAVATTDEVEDLVDELVRQRFLTWSGVLKARIRESQRGRRGLGALGAVIEQRLIDDGVSDSRLETYMAQLAAHAGLPRPRFHLPLIVGGRRIVPDFTFGDAKVIVEVDGFAFHGDRGAFERDRERDALAATAGWLVLRFTWRQIVERPAEVVARLRAVLELRHPRPRWTERAA